MDALHASFAARIENLAAMLDFIESGVPALQLPATLGSKLLLIAEELFTNTTRHGGVEACALPISLSLSRSGDEVALTFEDSGSAYNPFENLNVDALEIPVSDRPIGRLGLILVSTMATRVSYERKGQRNCTGVWLHCPA